jgi:hypothetical protein
MQPDRTAAPAPVAAATGAAPAPIRRRYTAAQLGDAASIAVGMLAFALVPGQWIAAQLGLGA